MLGIAPSLAYKQVDRREKEQHGGEQKMQFHSSSITVEASVQCQSCPQQLTSKQAHRDKRGGGGLNASIPTLNCVWLYMPSYALTISSHLVNAVASSMASDRSHVLAVCMCLATPVA